uniref:Spermatogenesis-associated protein 20-like TRX domain-containing protein n=1 Tax=Leersia perrieri TaxID=77586 RepID=A0A0D9V9Z2_9ORYZ
MAASAVFSNLPLLLLLPQPLRPPPRMLLLLRRHHRLAVSSTPLRVLAAAAMSSSSSGSGPAGGVPSSEHGGRKPNRLAAEHSPYLLQHAHNPVDWYPWGEEAFEKARRKDIPIFLSIGYSTCHWCHVMEVESFENDEVAKILNDGFVSIKVDREERPDVDKVYMTYVSALYGGGGWPLSVFLSPNLKPLMGGTYFPPDDKYGRPGFKTVLRKVKDAWETKRDALEKTGNMVIEQLRDALSAKASSQDIPNDLAVYVDQCVEKLAGSYDPKFGGYGSAPKFPRPVENYIMLYKFRKHLESGHVSEAQNVMKMITHTLQCMARGGVHDHIGGGFHRYSVDECWHVPHFEKMLYDQGQIANVYLDTFLITGDEYYCSVAHDILDYLRRDMIGEEGEIYSAEDADSAEYEGAPRKKEGAFYVWTSKEIEDILGENAELFKNHYYVKSSGNCDLSRMSDPHDEFRGKNVLIERKQASLLASKCGKSLDEYAQILGDCRHKLFDVRSKRPKPHLDDKPREYLEAAEKAASFIKEKLYDASSNRMNHSYRNGPAKAPGFLDDYAFLINGLLDLYEYGEPSGNSVAAINLIRFSSIFDAAKSDGYKRNVEHLLAVFQKRLKELGIALPLMCCAADMLSLPSRKQVVLVGDKESAEFHDMVAAAFSTYDPNRTVIQIDPRNMEEMAFWESNNANIAEMARSSSLEKPAVAHVCQDFKCSPPVTSPDALRELLNKTVAAATSSAAA